ncbi:MAG TPA: ATP-binding protein [Candidatus Binataceae bacterium]|nr:ATP-binding protein [Candidatus Binataceae bacterium]
MVSWLDIKAQSAPSTPGDEAGFLFPILRELPARVWVKDAQGRYVFVNSEVTRALKIPPDKFIGSTDEELFPRVGHVYWRKDQLVLSSGQPLVTTDQVEQGRFLFCLRFPLQLEGKPHVATVGVDTTSHISALVGFLEMRDESFRNERMRSIGEMASGLVHDLNNNLNVSSLRLRVLKSKAAPDLHSDIEAIERSLEAATQRVANVREYVTSRREENLSSGDLEELLTAAINMVDFLIERTPTASGGTIRIVRKTAGALPQVPVLSNQFKHVIANLLLNAREAMPDGGVLTIETRLKPSSIEVAISDEGTGVPEELKSKIFEPFFTTKPNGNGLGLSMAQDVLSRMRGAISVVNRSPRGAEFTLSIPLAPKTD